MATDKWEIYQVLGGEWHWRRIEPGGSIVGASMQGYVKKVDCEINARNNGWND